MSALFEDETSIKRAAMATDFTRPHEVLLGYLPRITAEAPPGQRVRTVRAALLHSGRMTRAYQAANCETAALVAQRLGLSRATQQGLLDNFEWWNGAGGPRGLRGEAISPVARLVNVAGYAAFSTGSADRRPPGTPSADDPAGTSIPASSRRSSTGATSCCDHRTPVTCPTACSPPSPGPPYGCRTVRRWTRCCASSGKPST